jgi:hypothetical protein
MGHRCMGIRYRGMTLDVNIHGSGTRISGCTLDGRALEKPRITATMTGHLTTNFLANAVIAIFFLDGLPLNSRLYVSRAHGLYRNDIQHASTNRFLRSLLSWSHSPLTSARSPVMFSLRRYLSSPVFSRSLTFKLPNMLGA